MGSQLDQIFISDITVFLDQILHQWLYCIPGPGPLSTTPLYPWRYFFIDPRADT